MKVDSWESNAHLHIQLWKFCAMCNMAVQSWADFCPSSQLSDDLIKKNPFGSTKQEIATVGSNVHHLEILSEEEQNSCGNSDFQYHKLWNNLFVSPVSLKIRNGAKPI